MRHPFEDSCNMNILNWKLYRKINSIRTWSSRKVEFLREITSLLPLKFYVPFMTLQSIGFKFYTKVKKGSCVFCCSSSISFNPNSHLKYCSLAWMIHSMSLKTKLIRFRGELWELLMKIFNPVLKNYWLR